MWGISTVLPSGSTCMSAGREGRLSRAGLAGWPCKEPSLPILPLPSVTASGSEVTHITQHLPLDQCGTLGHWRGWYFLGISDPCCVCCAWGSSQVGLRNPRAVGSCFLSCAAAGSRSYWGEHVGSLEGSAENRTGEQGAREGGGPGQAEWTLLLLPPRFDFSVTVFAFLGLLALAFDMEPFYFIVVLRPLQLLR